MAQVKEKIIEVQGLQAHYWEAGEQHGREILLLHGGVGDAHSHWHAVLSPLGDHFHVLAPDLPGFGQSAKLPQTETCAVLDWLQAFFDELDLEQAVVVGNCFGALLARLFAAEHPQYVPAVILVNGGAVLEFSPSVRAAMHITARVPALSKGLFRLLARLATTRKTVSDMIYNKDVLGEDFYAAVRAATPGFARFMRMFTLESLPEARTPLVPTLLLWGAEDTVATLEDAEAIKDSIPGSQLNAIADCGHMPQLEVSDVFVWQVEQFLDRLDRAPGVKLPGVGQLRQLP